ncbi:unnamed protein product [Adineta ricciae]|uniref:Protein quiver n=1 Tax=Adineta ricciae TaxID=249248 RepID=A0A815ZK48_ADIRI|nr:unnamed protein product [Adineta ricciae]
MFLFMAILSNDLVSSLSCYKCFSINGSNPSCEDLFHGDIAGRTSFLQTPCITSLRKRNGTFPATHCIKLVAYSNAPKPVQYTYRTCGREELDDNGINRASHCGFVKLDWIDAHRRFRGCLQICDRDACNQTTYSFHSKWNIVFALSFFIMHVFD